jgi:hypothetical protein
MPADNELTAKLTRRLDRNEALEQGQHVTNTYRTTGVSIYSEFSEFSRKQIKEYEKAFKKYEHSSSFFHNCDNDLLSFKKEKEKMFDA